MRRIFAVGLFAAIVVCGCQVKEENEFAPEGKSFTATMEATKDDATAVDTKTSLDNLNVLWKQGDQVSIFAGSTVNEQYQVTDASDGKTTAALNPVSGPGSVTGSDISANVAFYPYTSTASISSSGSNYVISNIALPATQDYAEDSFGNGAFPMAAVTSSTNDLSLKFKNILGSLKLQLKGTATITSISVTGNNNEVLCGAASVTMSSTTDPAITLTDATATTVTLDCGSGVQLSSNTAKTFIIALPPMTMTGGFTVVVYDSEGASMEIKTINSQTIARSNLLRMPAVTYVGTAPALVAVNLGLTSGLKWASCNLGASAPEEYGDYYAWGETEPYYSSQSPLAWKDGKSAGYNWASYQWCNGSGVSITKYCAQRIYGTVDNITELEEDDDAAHVILGGDWRMPTPDEFTELMSECDWEPTTKNGVDGYLVTGPNDNSIFLPFAGLMEATYLAGAGEEGYYWSSSIATTASSTANGVIIGSANIECNDIYRYNGFSIRPVTDEEDKVISITLSDASVNVGAMVMLKLTVMPYNATNKAVNWSSDNTAVATVNSRGYVYGVSAGTATITATAVDGSGVYGSCTVTVNNVAVTSVELNKASQNLREGVSFKLTATVNPSNATNKAVTWSSNSTSVATVSSDGTVQGVSNGTATITVRTEDGGLTATCIVTVMPAVTSGAVDLGLTSGLKWASCNVGANAPEEYGDYFAWGETEPYYTAGHSQDAHCSSWENNKTGYNWKSYGFRRSGSSHSIVTFSKYNTSSGYGPIDNNTVLDPEDDAAAVNWGGSWRMPTDADWGELIDECSWLWTMQNGVNGYLVTGTNQNSIFLPAAGNRHDIYLGYEGSRGYYWSSSLDTEDPIYVRDVCFHSDNFFRYYNYRCSGLSVRPVTE